MVAMRKYTVEATRGADARVWVLQCVEVPGAISETRTLSQARELMREAISFAADVDEDDIDIVLVPHIAPESLQLVESAKTQLAELARLQNKAARSSRAAVRTLRDAGLNGSDSAAVLGMSRQRVSQLLNETATSAAYG